MLQCSIPYKSLTFHNEEYSKYLLLKGTVCTTKPGYISKKELQGIADTIKVSKNTLVRRINSLVENNLINKSRYGYTLTAKRIINNNLNLTTTNKKTGKIYTPGIKINVPATTDYKVIEVAKLYYLIQQIFNQYHFVLNGKRTDNRKVKTKRPERFELSIEKLMNKGKYSSKMEVWRLINLLENVGLIKIERGLLNIMGKNDCNRYTLLPFGSANWTNLYKTKRLITSFKQRLDNILNTPVSKKVITTKVKKAPNTTTYNKTEETFYLILKSGLQEILFSKGLVNSKTRKILKSQLPYLLVECLNDKDLRNIILSRINPDNILVEKVEGSYFDTDLDTFARDRYHHFLYDKVTLVENGGNYYFGTILYSLSDKRNEKFLELRARDKKQRNMLFYTPSSNLGSLLDELESNQFNMVTLS